MILFLNLNILIGEICIITYIQFPKIVQFQTKLYIESTFTINITNFIDFQFNFKERLIEN